METGDGGIVAPCCAICLSQSLGDLVCLSNCGHVFHRECVAVWLQKTHNCPSCKARTNPSTDVIKLWYNIEESNKSGYIQTPRTEERAHSAPTATVSTQTTSTGDYLAQTKTLKLQLQAERSRAGQLNHKLSQQRAEHEQLASENNQLKTQLEISRDRLKNVDGANDREQWLRNQLASAERAAETRHEKVLEELNKEQAKTKELAVFKKMTIDSLKSVQKEAHDLRKQNAKLVQQNGTLSEKFKTITSAYADIEFRHAQFANQREVWKKQIEALKRENDIAVAKEMALKESMEHMFQNKYERERIAKEYKRIMTIKKNRISGNHAANRRLGGGEKQGFSVNQSPIRAPTTERLLDLVKTGRPRESPSWFASSRAVSSTASVPTLPAMHIAMNLDNHYPTPRGRGGGYELR
jgi:hypothetical protein